MLHTSAVVDHAAYEGQQVGRFEGLGHIGIGTDVEALDAFLERNLGGKQDHGDMAVGNIFLDQLAELEAVHAQHHHVTDDDVWLDFSERSDGIGGIAFGDDAVGAAQYQAHEVDDLGLVIDYKHHGSAVRKIVVAGYGDVALDAIFLCLGR